MQMARPIIAESPATAVLPAADAARAREFYDGIGFETQEFEGTDQKYFYVKAGANTRFVVYQTEARAAESTCLAFEVDDIEAAVQDLRARGVAFEDYDVPGLKTVNGITNAGQMGRSAWFIDTEGNIISVVGP
jgi:predicted enzyme related to lactoylglutathione lyase